MRTSDRHHPGPWWLLTAGTAVLLLVATGAGASAGTTATHEAACDDELHRISPGSPVRADDAAVLTAQAVEVDSEGFALASWQVSDGVELTEIRVITVTGDTAVLPPAATGTVERAHTLVFCGSRAAAPGDAVPPTSGDTEVPEMALLTAAESVVATTAESVVATTAEAQGSRAFEVLAAALALLGIGLTAAGRSGRRLDGRSTP
jgi:hypothetical protein